MDCKSCKDKGWISAFNTDALKQEIQRCDDCGKYINDIVARKAFRLEVEPRVTVMVDTEGNIKLLSNDPEMEFKIVQHFESMSEEDINYSNERHTRGMHQLYPEPDY